MVKYYNYIIFHKKCLDGFTGFLIFNKTKLINKDAKILPDVPSANHSPDNIENKDIIIIDVAYKYNVLRDIIIKARSVLFIDHHVTIRDDVLKLEKEFPNKLITHYDINKSGATLVWEYFFKSKPKPKFIEYIQDNDIGTWKLYGVHEFITALHVNYSFELSFDNIKKWNQLYKKSTINKLIKLGKTYNEYKSWLVDENSKRISIEKFPSNLIYDKYQMYFDKPGQYKVAVYCGSSCPAASQLSEKILTQTKCDFFISWVLNLDRREYVLTLRSNKVNVGQIAKIFNGGGHELAAACSFKMDKYVITDLFYGESLPRH
jgi:hypothetical protein